ncbi:MAG: DUF4331 domain-containing protein [Rhodospirillales bacterium]|nr:DUF4331 domain-containing protein [Rhodospirillales bacterium]
MKPSTFASAIAGSAVLAAAMAVTPAMASSHMDAPLITYDDPANTTDVYAFVSEEDGDEYLTTALAVYPFEEPGIGPNNYSFDPRVSYEIHVSLGDDIAEGRASLSYRFEFETSYVTEDTILQAYLGEVEVQGKQFPGRNLTQTYSVTKVDHRTGQETSLKGGVVPPNNQGLVTPLYNRNDDGDMPAKEGVAREDDLDPYTRAAITNLRRGYRAFAGQRDDGFYADIQSIFDLDFDFGRVLDSPAKPFDSQGGYNVHTIVLDIPMEELEDAGIAGVHATTSRKVETPAGLEWRQVGRQGNPLFAEALIAIAKKDLYNQTQPTVDAVEFAEFAEDPELSRIFGVQEILPGLISSIFIPDMIKVDLTTGPARLAGQEGFDRLGVFAGNGAGAPADVLQSQVQDPLGNGGFISGGWPNGRRFGDDVVDIAVIALGLAGPADLAAPGLGFAGADVDRVTENDITYNDVFPYAATPLNGRNHGHHGETDGAVELF